MFIPSALPDSHELRAAAIALVTSEHDAIRRRWLREHGWTLIVVRLGDFSGDALLRWIRDLRCELKASYTTRRF